MKNKYTHQCAVPIILCLLITFNSSPIFSQDQPRNRITGVVSDETGPLLGASIIVKNTSKGTVTDTDGTYTITAHPTDTLVFSYLGYRIREIPVNLSTGINVTLTADETSLDQVVVNAGYYTTTDKKRTGNIGRVSASEIDKQPIANPLEALQGRVTGVDIIQNSGVPGGGFKVRIRGQNSLMAGNEPLYIIDGVPYDTQTLASGNTSGGIIPLADSSPLNAINPESIESIEILKDADATAIYGSRGANGVVLITTKKGKEGKTQITVSTTTGIAHINRKAKLLNSKQYLEVRKEAFANDGITEYPGWAYDINGTWDMGRYTDWQKELIGGTANMHKLTAQFSGGSSNTQFLLNGQYQEETTVFPGDFNYDRLTVNSNLSHQGKGDRFKLTFTAGYTLEKNRLPDRDFTQDAQWLPPNAPSVYDSEGNINWENSTWSNPLARLDSKYIQHSQNLISNTVISYSIIDDLEMKVNAGYGFSLLGSTTAIPHTIYDPAYGYDSGASVLTTSEGSRAYWISEPQLRWQKDFDVNSFDVIIGTTFQQDDFKQGSVMGRGFPSNNFLNNIAAASSRTILEENKTSYKYHSIFGRINYGYRNMFYINATGRRDGSSRFGSNNKYGNFGALGVGWIFTKGENLSWLNFGKIRGSYGMTGNDQIGDYQYLDTYGLEDYSYDGNIGLVPARIYNPNFKWEKIEKREVAVELQFLENKIALSTAYYNNRSSNQLIDYALPATTGFTSIQANLDAEVENSGFEFELLGTIMKNNDFSWNGSFNLSLPKNKLLAFPGLENSVYANRYIIGEPLGIVKLYNLEGVNPETGLFEFTDFNGDGVISSEWDRQYIADLSPKFFGGLSNSVSFKSWSLDFLFQFVKKKGYNQYRYTEPPGLMLNHFESVLDRWQQPGDHAHMQRYTTGENYEAYLAYSRFTQSSGVISDASFIRLRSMELAYNFWVNGDKGTSCRVFLQGLNLLTFSSFSGGDPEQIKGFIPPLRRITLGVQLVM